MHDRDGEGARKALAAGAKTYADFGYGFNALMLAAAMEDHELVEELRRKGVVETLETQPYLDVLKFHAASKQPGFIEALGDIERLNTARLEPYRKSSAILFRMPSNVAEQIVKEHQKRLLEKGCYIVALEHNDGSDDDGLLALPTTDQFTVIAFVGTDGINYDINNYLVIRWMRNLYRDQPFMITGCGKDFLEGKFIELLHDPGALAKRMYTFCPDIVDQGTRTVDNLAKEIKETNSLYFWWD